MIPLQRCRAGLDHHPGRFAGCKVAGPHRGPYGSASVGSAVRTSNLQSSRVAGVMIKAVTAVSGALRREAELPDPEHGGLPAFIQKAVGWMLREVGERDRPSEEALLRGRARQAPTPGRGYASACMIHCLADSNSPAGKCLISAATK